MLEGTKYFMVVSLDPYNVTNVYFIISDLGKGEKHQLLTLHLRLLHLINKFLYAVLHMILFSYRYYFFLVINTCTIIE